MRLYQFRRWLAGIICPDEAGAKPEAVAPGTSREPMTTDELVRLPGSVQPGQRRARLTASVSFKWLQTLR